MSGLVEFLLARIGEDEAVAKAVTPGPWLNVENEQRVIDFATQDAVPPGTELAARMHALRWFPGRVLAECAAKRRVVEAARNYSPELEHGDNGEWAFDVTLRALALPHADHPDYREEWRP